MKRSVFLSLLAAGLTLPSAAQRAPKPSFKGMELYSWEKDGQFFYALMVGTNRNKSWKEVQQNGLADDAALQEALARLAVGESVFWMNRCDGGPNCSLKFPGLLKRKQLAEYCSSLKIELVMPANLKAR